MVPEQRVPGCVRHHGGLAAEEDAGAHRIFAGTHARVHAHGRNVVLHVCRNDVDDAKREAGCTGCQDQQLLELAERIGCPCSRPSFEGFEVREPVFREQGIPAHACF